MLLHGGDGALSPVSAAAKNSAGRLPKAARQGDALAGIASSAVTAVSGAHGLCAKNVAKKAAWRGDALIGVAALSLEWLAAD